MGKVRRACWQVGGGAVKVCDILAMRWMCSSRYKVENVQ